MRYLFTLLYLCPGLLIAQFTTLTLNNCPDLSADTLRVEGSYSCICGYSGQGIELDGNQDSLLINGVDASYFNGDFTFRFLMDPEPGLAVTQEIFSLKDSCFSDHILTIRYVGGTREIFIEMIETIDRSIFLSGVLGPAACWHEVVFQKEAEVYRLFLDGEEVQNTFISGGIRLQTDASFRLAGGSCSMTSDSRYRGRIDEIQFERGARPRFMISGIESPDRLITRDTVIFAGEPIDAESIINCATSVSWLPVDGVSDPGAASPRLSPSVTTHYAIRYDAPDCQYVDSLRVQVITESDIDCGRLDLPTAFTPNGDGLNETFGISNPFIVDELITFEIYDRQGARVYSTSDIAQPWNGRWGTGERLGPGAYLWKVNYRCRGTEYFNSGSVAILK